MRRFIKVCISLSILFGASNLYFLSQPLEEGRLENTTITSTRSHNSYDPFQSKYLQNEYLSWLGQSKVMTSASVFDDDMGIIKSPYNATKYQMELDQTLKPLSNSSTACFYQSLYGGFCNQYELFLGIVFIAQLEGKGSSSSPSSSSFSSKIPFAGYNQIIEESIAWKDTHGKEKLIPHHKLFDVVHWNQFDPVLPRFVKFDPDIHTDLTPPSSTSSELEMELAFFRRKEDYPSADLLMYKKHLGDPFVNATKPYAIGAHRNMAKNRYMQFAKRIDKSLGSTGLNSGSEDEDEQFSVYRHIVTGALRPHPEIQHMLDEFLQQHGLKVRYRGQDRGQKQDESQSQSQSERKNNGEDFVVLHARVEPDMYIHRMCKDKKVVNMTDIVEMVHAYYPEPPASTVLLVFNRFMMEQEANGTKIDDMHKITVHNLNVINHMVENGLWGGQVRVIEVGSKVVELHNMNASTSDTSAQNESTASSRGGYYGHFSTIVGGIMNFFLALDAKIFIGTEVSTYSTLNINSRFYRGERQNYFYRPGGLHWVTPVNGTKPHRFVC
uniref:O-fucosyltransferase family protein n=1 Tax=Chaetoceros debilis TaxID=122233 RepID=A0A7S3QEQ1_9STRA|mmetsp:Transcript_17533/g.26533  ORF Transcript_17533/g.26533 Transcript_17533/m.26533 type:complete len:552 (+) Transcript_17533:43-1698(+)